jgi:hypothetical protein
MAEHRDLLAVSGSMPFVHNVDAAPAYWWLDILWVILVKGEDTGGRYSLMYEALPKGSGAPPHKHTWSDEHFYILEGDLTFLVGDEVRCGVPAPDPGRRDADQRPVDFRRTSELGHEQRCGQGERQDAAGDGMARCLYAGTLDHHDERRIQGRVSMIPPVIALAGASGDLGSRIARAGPPAGGRAGVCASGYSFWRARPA